MSSNVAPYELETRIGEATRRLRCRQRCLRRNPALLQIFCCVLLLTYSGCSQPGKSTGKSASSRGSLIAEGDEVGLDSATRRLIDQSRPGGGRIPNTNTANTGEERWSIVLATASGPNHQAVAQGICQNVQRQYPQLRGAFVRSTERGSAVWFGRFASPDSKEAVIARERIQTIGSNGQKVFPSAFLSVLPDDSPMGEYDLRKARLMYPGVDPLYTLQIACWGTFDSAAIDWDTVRKESERYAAELRRRGHQAWYYHDPVTQLSVVTLGVFDRSAYDPQTTLFSPEVELLKRQFPLHLINGEEVLIEMRPGDSSTRVPQQCRLVTVPSL